MNQINSEPSLRKRGLHPRDIQHLELGCGPYPFRLIELYRQGIKNILSVDLDLSPHNGDFQAFLTSWELVNQYFSDDKQIPSFQTKQLTIPKDLQDRLIQGEAVQILQQFPDDHFDTISGDYFIHKVLGEKAHRMLPEIHRTLKPQGKAIFTLPKHSIPVLGNTLEQHGFICTEKHDVSKFDVQHFRLRISALCASLGHKKSEVSQLTCTKGKLNPDLPLVFNYTKYKH